MELLHDAFPSYVVSRRERSSRRSLSPRLPASLVRSSASLVIQRPRLPPRALPLLLLSLSLPLCSCTMRSQERRQTFDGSQAVRQGKRGERDTDERGRGKGTKMMERMRRCRSRRMNGVKECMHERWHHHSFTSNVCVRIHSDDDGRSVWVSSLSLPLCKAVYVCEDVDA